MKIKEIWELLLEVFFPSSPIEKKVKGMTLEEFNDVREISFDSKNRVLSFFRYKNPLIREAIRQMKYRGNKKLAKIFAEIIYSEILEELSDWNLFENFKKPILVAVPMSSKEKRERGYNQVELLIDEIIEESLTSDFKMLQKIKNTSRQTKLKREERLKNVRGAFKFNPARSDLARLNVVLFDDVSTTGATISEAKRILECAGAKVFAVVVAR
jgi:competence protein ComFC